MRTLFGFRLVCGVAAGVLAASGAWANSDQIVIFNTKYPTTVGQANQASNCTICHAGAPTLNAYGLAFRNSAAGPDSANGLAQIEFLDTDGDGFTNLHEILRFNLPANAANKPAAANTAPVLGAIGNKNLNENQTLNFTVTVTDDVVGLAPLLTATGLPSGATFTDNRNGTATFNWVTDFADGGTYPGVVFTANDGLLTDTETITITVADLNQAPAMNNVDNQYVLVGQTLSFTLEGFDNDSPPLAFSQTGLPAGAVLTDNGDDTATVSWTPTAGDIGIYTDITFTVEDDAAQSDSDTITIFVGEAPAITFEPETPFNNSNATDEVLDYRADLATDGAGNWVAVWYVSDTGIITAQTSADNGETWSNPIPVSAVDGGDEAPQVATDRAGNWMVVWRTDNNLSNTIGDDYDILYARSTDNGASWGDPTILNPDAATDVSEERGPNIECDGNVWVATWMSNNTDINVMRSTNAGDTWEAPIYVGNGHPETFPDTTRPGLASDGAGHWVLVWSNGTAFAGTGNDIDVQVARSDDGAATWKPTAKLNTNNVSDSGDDQLPTIATDRAGTWIAVWTSTDTLGGTIGTDADIVFSRSTDNGATWSAPAPLAVDAPYDGFQWDVTPSLATDTHGAWVAAWYTGSNLIRICYSTDNGATWSLPIIQNTIHDDTTRTPQVASDEAGAWLAVWETNENPSDQGYDFDLMISRGSGPGAGIQTADQNGNNVISLSELLRVIQFYNSLGLHCADNPGDTEDGFVPGPGANESCAAHDTDQDGNWVIILSELLRVIQFYNSLGYYYCPADGTEDGYCPGQP